jgi:hypothetical protein
MGSKLSVGGGMGELSDCLFMTRVLSNIGYPCIYLQTLACMPEACGVK